jgi:hypothetical protein
VADHAAAQFKISIAVPIEYHARIIGPRGSNITQYRTKYGVNVNVPRNEDPEHVNDQITIVGYEDKANECRKDIEQLLNEWQAMVRHDVKIDPRIHARIIGGRGRGVAKVMEQFKVTIRFPREGDADPSLVTVEGNSEDAVLDAVDHLRNLEEEFMQDYVERGQYDRSQQHQQQQHQQQGAKQASLTITNAPWDVNSATDFPSMAAGEGGSSGGNSTTPGVWGRKR